MLLLNAIFVFSLIVWCISCPASAAIFTYGTSHNYSAVVLPDNSYVHQGENISQGLNYDLSGIYGFSGKLAWWEDSDDVGFTYPDKIVTLDFTRKPIYIDPEKFPVGDWYQFDGSACKNEDDYCTRTLGRHGNSYVFHVVAPAEPLSEIAETRTEERSITIFSNGTSIEIPVTVTVEVPVVTHTPDTGAVPFVTITVPTPEPTKYLSVTPAIVTPKSPGSPVIPAFALLIISGVILYRRK